MAGWNSKEQHLVWALPAVQFTVLRSFVRTHRILLWMYSAQCLAEDSARPQAEFWRSSKHLSPLKHSISQISDFVSSAHQDKFGLPEIHYVIYTERMCSKEQQKAPGLQNWFISCQTLRPSVTGILLAGMVKYSFECFMNRPVLEESSGRLVLSVLLRLAFRLASLALHLRASDWCWQGRQSAYIPDPKNEFCHLHSEPSPCLVWSL